MHHCLALALSLWATTVSSQSYLMETGHIFLGHGHDAFGGFSGIELTQDGQEGWIITDYGQAMRIDMRRDEDKRLTTVSIGEAIELNRPYRDIPLNTRKDTEGFAFLPGGGIAISMEQPSRVWIYDKLTKTPTLEAPHFDLGILMRETGLEALAVDAQGRLITITEHKLRKEDWMFPILRLEDGEWMWLGNLRKMGPFLPVGADFGPDGQLYLLERAASLLGFRSRISRLNISDPNPEREILMQSTVGQYDNLEGLTVWHDSKGALRLTTISDNNFLRIQRSEIVEFRLEE